MICAKRIVSFITRTGPQPTWRIGLNVGVSTDEARRILRQMQRANQVSRDRRSTCNNTLWCLPGADTEDKRHDR